MFTLTNNFNDALRLIFLLYLRWKISEEIIDEFNVKPQKHKSSVYIKGYDVKC